MPTIECRPNLPDFSLIKTRVGKTKEDFSLSNSVNAFYYFVLDLLFDLQEDEIKDSITDTNFLSSSDSDSNETGHDRGIDALYIDQSGNRSVIHFFNFKHVSSFEKSKNNFPANEIDKICTFLTSLMEKDEHFSSEINWALKLKVEEIWSIFDRENPRFVFHLCSNRFQGLETQQKKRFEREVKKYSDFEVSYHFLPELVKCIREEGRISVDAKLRAIDKCYFEKSDGDIRALILSVDARDLIRIVLDDSQIRSNVDIEDDRNMRDFQILEDALQDNVRIYLKQRSKINKNIKKTALSDEKFRIFYYNNGITITCKHFEYPSGRRSPIIDIENLQVVNGGQTVHALYEAFREDSSCLDDTQILVRLYETRNKELSTKIAEYTNSQNPVSSRDIRSIDFIQQTLEKEFEALGLFYERKRKQHSGKPKEKRIDSEKVGQVLIAFYNKMPAEAKNKKSIIFGTKYDDVFSDNISADKIMVPYNLFLKIEQKKDLKKDLVQSYEKKDPAEFHFVYSSYFILYLIGELGKKLKVPCEISQIPDLWKLYEVASTIISDLIRKEVESLKDEFVLANFFKGKRAKKLLDEIFESDEISTYLSQLSLEPLETD